MNPTDANGHIKATKGFAKLLIKLPGYLVYEITRGPYAGRKVFMSGNSRYGWEWQIAGEHNVRVGFRGRAECLWDLRQFIMNGHLAPDYSTVANTHLFNPET